MAPSLTSEAETWEALPSAGPGNLHATPTAPLAAAGGFLQEELRPRGRSQGSPGNPDTILQLIRDRAQQGTLSARQVGSSESSLMEEKQILCVGLVVLDIINVVDKYPEEDTDRR